MKTVSLELAKQLREAGYPQEATFWFVDTRKSWKEYNQQNSVFIPFEGIVEGDPELELGINTDGNKGYNDSKPLASPTADEILDRLPRKVEYKLDVGFRDADLKISKTFNNEDYFLRYSDIGLADHVVYHFVDKNLANAAAQMYIFLKKENLL